MSHESFPLLPRLDPATPIAWYNGKAVSQQRFLQQVEQLVQQLPQHPYAINLCEDRYHFLLAFTAMLLTGKVNLLPTNRSTNELQSVADRYDDCPCLVDKQQEGLANEQLVIEPDELKEQNTRGIPMIPADRICAVVFTSGSTGQSVPWEKSWGEFYCGAKLTERMLGLGEIHHCVVATVPSQHMYGLETSIILPLVTGMSLYNGRPFFPTSLHHALCSVPTPRLLVTTPVHLRACIETEIDWPQIDGIISATAPLTQNMAERAEQHFGGKLQEIYGSTETGAIATRRTRTENNWLLHHGLQLHADVENENSYSIEGGHLPRPVPLHDHILKQSDERFTLLGRNSDMVKIAGKRVSLGDLNHKLLTIPGVKDGVFVESAINGQQSVPRLCALVVAPELTQKDILDALRRQIDPACLPRPLYQVPQLPRTEAGKLPRRALLELLDQLGKH